MKSMSTLDWIIKYSSLNNYTSDGGSNNEWCLNLPKSINKKNFKVFYDSKLQILNNSFYVRLQNVITSCFDNGISGVSVKTCNGIYLNDLTPYWSEAILNKNDYFRYSLSSTDPVILIANKWSGWNYFHFLHTSLPKLAFFQKLKEAIPFVKIIHNSVKKSFIQEAFDLLHIDYHKDVICFDEFKSLFVTNLHVVSPIGSGVNPSPDSCWLLKELFKEHIQEYHDSLKIYVKRKGIRIIINEDEVINYLLTLGFQIVDSEMLSFKDQINLFSKAKVVISAHGAGLSNLVWCHLGTKVLELMSPRYIGLCYYLISNACNLDYHYLVGEGKWSDDANYCWSDGTANIKINMDELKESMELLWS